ncbi:MAG: hypothetical protein ACLFSU_06205 [Acholeplasmataceae bacterium]
MFQEAIKKTKNYTTNVVLSMRRLSGKVDTAMFTAIILNKDGDFLSSAHTFQAISEYKQHQEQIKKNRARREEIRTMGLSKEQEQAEMMRILDHPMSITHIDFYVPRFKASIDISTLKTDYAKDLATFRLKNRPPMGIEDYPRFFDNNQDMQVGTQLCRLGYAFNEARVAFAPKKGFLFFEKFSTQEMYPNDGMLTRLRTLKRSSNVPFEGTFIELSTPGLKGQSGCAIFDTYGTVYGIQSHTSHLPLNMAVPFPNKMQVVTLEHQVLNVGLGVHSVEIEKFLLAHSIDFWVA